VPTDRVAVLVVPYGYRVARLPTGTVTFFFSDVEGSTRLLQELGDTYRDLVDEHHRVIKSAIEDEGGTRISTEGDGVFAVFVAPIDAVTAAASAQRGLADRSWPSDVDVRVRMGIHTGEGALGLEGYVGLDVHRAARIASVSNGGQVVMSGATCSLVERSLPEGLRLADLGLHRLKDLAAAEHIFQLVIADLPTDTRPLRSLDAVRNNLPVQLTSFVGRGTELDELREIASRSRIVTLTGVGGTGKTRLAYQLAADTSHEYPDGVWVIELAALVDPDIVANEVATEMGLRPQTGESIRQTLISVIAEQRVLIVLDNCEHLLDAVADLTSELLRAGSGVTVVATSRESLGVAGELTYRVASLKVPDDVARGREEVAGYDAVVLFVERAALARPGFELTDANAEAVVKLCRRLDGVPLALELAAARVRSLSPEDIASRLDDRFRLLAGGSRSAVPRQRTLEATVAWSYDSLDDVEKQVFERLSVFSGGFTLEMTERICAGDGVDDLDAVDALLSLVEKSLVTVDEDRLGTRYRLLETLRQYAHDRLVQRADPAHLRSRHAEEFADLGERLARELQGRGQVDAFRQFEVEHDNFRAALTWSLDAPDRPVLARLVASLARYWLEAGHWTEGRVWVAEVVGDETLPLDLQIEAAIAGQDMTLSADLSKNAVLTEQALERAGELDDPVLLGRAMAAHGLSVAWIGDVEGGIELLESAVRHCRVGADRWVLADSLKHLGNVLARLRSDACEQVLIESLEIFRDLGDQLRTAEVLHLAGRDAWNQGRDIGRERLTESLQLFRDVGSRSGEGHALLALGELQRSHGEDVAAETLADGLRVLMDVGDHNCAASTEVDLAFLAIDDDPESAERRVRTALKMSEAVGNLSTMARSLEIFAKLAARAGDLERATSLFAAAEPVRTASGRVDDRNTSTDRQPEFDLLREQLGAENYRSAWEAGVGMTSAEAVEYALASRR
jgi:predicted ATPase/class 3 adenylate cyclase